MSTECKENTARVAHEKLYSKRIKKKTLETNIHQQLWGIMAEKSWDLPVRLLPAWKYTMLNSKPSEPEKLWAALGSSKYLAPYILSNSTTFLVKN